MKNFNDFSMTFQDKILNFHGNSKCHKNRKTCSTTGYIWPPHTSYDHSWVFFLRKSLKVFISDLLNSKSVNNMYVIGMNLLMYLANAMHISKFNDFSMSDRSEIQ